MAHSSQCNSCRQRKHQLLVISDMAYPACQCNCDTYDKMSVQVSQHLTTAALWSLVYRSKESKVACINSIEQCWHFKIMDLYLYLPIRLFINVSFLLDPVFLVTVIHIIQQTKSTVTPCFCQFLYLMWLGVAVVVFMSSLTTRLLQSEHICLQHGPGLTFHLISVHLIRLQSVAVGHFIEVKQGLG